MSGGTRILQSDATNFSAGTDSTLKLDSQDGYAAGSLIEASFDPDGHFVTSYSNGQTDKHGRLALGWFTHTDALEQVGGNLFENRYGHSARSRTPGRSRVRQGRGGHVEMSNVDLSQQFSEMIITQRGYQASSQVITTANEMIQQLIDMGQALMGVGRFVCPEFGSGVASRPAPCRGAAWAAEWFGPRPPCHACEPQLARETRSAFGSAEPGWRWLRCSGVNGTDLGCSLPSTHARRDRCSARARGGLPAWPIA